MDSLLTEWANVRTEKPDQAYTPAMKALIERSDAEIGRLVGRYPEFFSSIESGTTSRWELVYRVRVFLRLAWDAPDSRQREWHIFQARDAYHRGAIVEPMFQALLDKTAPPISPSEIRNDLSSALIVSPPPYTPFERLMCRFQGIAASAHHCQNPECPAPYFLGKKGQKYCSESCAAPSRREQNRRWWRENRGSGKNGGNK